MLIKNANVFRNDERRFENCDVRIIDGFITEIGIIDDADDEVYDAKGKRITSGLIDVHTHGIAGKDFLDADDEYMHKMAVAYASRGIVAVMPTVASAPISQMLDTVEKINHFSPSSNEARFCGAHIEGRYLNPQKSGAHAPSMLAPLNASELDARALSECRALHISAAYELDEDGSFEYSEDGTVTAVGACEDPVSEERFFQGAVVPGFVNAHCHVELSHLHKKFRKGTGMAGFIDQINELRDWAGPEVKTRLVKEWMDKMWADGVSAMADISNDDSSFPVKASHPMYTRTFLEG